MMKKAFDAQREFIVTASKCKKPDQVGVSICSNNYYILETNFRVSG